MATRSRDPADRTFLDDLSLDLTALAAMLAHYAERYQRRRQREAHDRITPEQVRTLLAARYARTAAFGHDLCNPGWSLLLELFKADLEKRPVNLAQLATNARVARTTALRWVRDLSTSGFVPRAPDAHVRSGMEIALTDAGREAMEDQFVALLLGLGGP